MVYWNIMSEPKPGSNEWEVALPEQSTVVVVDDSEFFLRI